MSAFELARLEELVRQRTQALLEGLVGVLGCRDTETLWHSRRVSLYSRKLGGALGMGEPELAALEQGALLHDLGKVGVREGVLLKAGQLSPDEWVEMKKHPELGWRLLRRVEHLALAASIVLHHHERWDGTGYPAGLAGEAIVLGARVFHVADTLDAMTSDRPYRQALSFAAAQAEIARCAGSQFDPRVVEAFLRTPQREWDLIRRDVETVALLVGEHSRGPSP